jgi:hypothetical protein
MKTGFSTFALIVTCIGTVAMGCDNKPKPAPVAAFLPTATVAAVVPSVVATAVASDDDAPTEEDFLSEGANITPANLETELGAIEKDLK